MKVKVIKASVDSFWYKDHIGEVFEVEKRNSRYGPEYVVLPFDPNGSHYIDAADCELVEDDEGGPSVSTTKLML